MRDTKQTSIWSYYDEENNFPRLQDQVLAILENSPPMTARAIRDAMAKRWQWIELSSISGILNALHKEKMLIEAKIDPCPITKRKVRYHALSADLKTAGD